MMMRRDRGAVDPLVAVVGGVVVLAGVVLLAVSETVIIALVTSVVPLVTAVGAYRVSQRNARTSAVEQENKRNALRQEMIDAAEERANNAATARFETRMQVVALEAKMDEQREQIRAMSDTNHMLRTEVRDLKGQLAEATLMLRRLVALAEKEAGDDRAVVQAQEFIEGLAP